VAAGRVEVRVAIPYPVVVGAGLDLGEVVSGALEPTVGVILTDSNVGPLHAASLEQALEGAGWRVADMLEIPAGERSKSLQTSSGASSSPASWRQTSAGSRRSRPASSPAAWRR
jgi:3-dehydroquinate synthetase